MQDWKALEKEYEAKIATSYEDRYYGRYLEKYYLQHFIKFLRKYVRSSDSILDLGCATGILEEALLKIGYRDIVGVDISCEMVAVAKEKVKGIDFHVADGEKLPFEDSSFDVIVCSSTLHHFPELSGILLESKRVLKEYGVIIVREPNKEHHFTKPSWLSGAVMNMMHYFYRIERCQPISEPPMHQYHRAFKAEELLEQFSKHFTIINFSSYFPFSCFYTKLKNRFIIRSILFIEKFLKNMEGSQFYLVAANYDSSFPGVQESIEKHIRYLEKEKKEPKCFIIGMYCLLWLAKLYEKRKK